MNTNEIKCKTALSKSMLPGLTYSLNPYRGCQHNCAYCYVPNVLRINRNLWGSFVDIKTNIPVILSKEVKSKKPATVGISTVTDAYQPVEKKYKLTRYCLEQLLKYDFSVCIQTKSSLVLRDIDLISKFTDAEVLVSIGTINDKQRKMLEPFTSSISERLKVLKSFSDIGIKSSVFFGPIYPSIKKENINNLIDTFIANGATDIMFDKLNLKPGILKNIEEIISSNNELKYVFLTNLKGDYSKYYNEIIIEINRIKKYKKIKIISAF
jgi:DNA repair photolyase